MADIIKDLKDCNEVELQELYRVYKLSFCYYDIPFDVTKQRALMDSLLNAPWFHGFVHIEYMKVTSFLFFIDSYSSIQAQWKIRIEEIFVEESKRRRGIGQKLIDRVKAYCRENGVVIIELNAEADSADTLDFYGRVGFKAIPHLTMQAKINLLESPEGLT